MGTTKRTTKTGVTFVGTLDELPDATRGLGGKSGPDPRWAEVAERVKAESGTWHIVAMDHLTIAGHKSAVHSINAASRDSQSKTGKNTAFVEPGYQAAYRKGHGLLVRYDAPATVTQIQKRGRKASAA
jgi:hypothetical protein